MSPAHEPLPDDQQLVRYLLGLLPNEDADRVDELSVADDEVAGRLRLVENDLVDAYVTGALAGETLERFESFYLSSPRRRGKVRFAREFLRAIDRAVGPPDLDSGATLRPALHERFPARTRAFWRIAVAASVLLVTCAALVFQVVRLRSGLVQTQQTTAAITRRAGELEQQLAAERAAHAEVVEDLERARQSAMPQLTRPSARGVSEMASSQPLAMAALVLSPETRAIGPIATVMVPAGADRVAFALRLESHDFPQYSVALKDPRTSDVIWRTGRILATSIGGETTISILVPAVFLKSQHYSLELTGHHASQRPETIGSYTFRAVRR